MTEGTNTTDRSITAESREEILAALRDVTEKVAETKNKIVYFKVEWGEVSGKMHIKMVEKV